MSTTNSRQALFRDQFLTPVTHDLYTNGITSSRPNILMHNPVMPTVYNNWFYAPEIPVRPDTPTPKRPIQPLKRVHPEEGCSLLSEASVSVRNAAYTLSEYNRPQRGERTPSPLEWKASMYRPPTDVLSESPATGNVWDMLVGLVGTEGGSEFNDTIATIPTSHMGGKHYFSEADVCVASPQEGSNHQELSVSKCNRGILTNVGYQNSVKVADSNIQVTPTQSRMKVNNAHQVAPRHQRPIPSEHCHCSPLNEENGSLCGSEHLRKYELLASDEETNSSKKSKSVSSRNNETVSKRGNDAAPVPIYEDRLSSACVHDTNVMQQKSIKPKSTTSKSRRKASGLPKQKKLRKTNLLGKENLEERDELALPKPEVGEGMAKQKHVACHSVHPDYDQTPYYEQMIEDPAIQLSRKVDLLSLSRMMAITMQGRDAKEDFMRPDAVMKHLYPLPTYERVNLLLMNNHKSEISPSNVLVLSFDAQPKLSLESECDHENYVRSLLKKNKGFNQNPHVTGLLISAQVPELQNASSESSEISLLTNQNGIKGTVNPIKPLTGVSISLENKVHEAGQSSICRTRNFPQDSGLVAHDGLLAHDALLERREGWNIGNPAQVYLQVVEGALNQKATTMGERFSPDLQLKLLLHASHCRLPECPVASCAKTQKLLKHCTYCKEEYFCLVSRCTVSKTLLKHWSLCTVFHCPLCASAWHHEQVKSTIMPTRREMSFSTNSSKENMYASFVSNSNRSLADSVVPATATTTGTGTAARIGSTSTFSEGQIQTSTLPRTVIIPSRTCLPDKINTSEFTQCSSQESQRCLDPNICRRGSKVNQPEWESPLGSNGLGEDLHQISWTMNLEPDNQEPSAYESESKNNEEGPKLAAGFTLSSQHLQQRLDCLLHGVICEKSDKETSKDCVKKHCNIMKSSMVHMSSCREFTSCSNVICLLFSPLLLHWKSCRDPCSVCGPINVKYNKNKLLKKIFSPAVVANERKWEKVTFEGYGETDGRRRQGIRSTPYYLRDYMMEDKDQSPVPVASNGYTQPVAGRKVEETRVPSAGNTWNQLPGIDSVLARLPGEALKPDPIHNVGSTRTWSQEHYNFYPHSVCHSYSECNNDLDNYGMKDLLNAIHLYNQGLDF